MQFGAHRNGVSAACTQVCTSRLLCISRRTLRLGPNSIVKYHFLYSICSASWCMLSTLLAVITAMRTYGICISKRRWLIPGTILCLLLVSPVFAIVSVVYTLYQSAPQPVACLINSTRFVFSMNC
ncbi:hypothetical protein C8Q72DRAFT_318106 [Fomitopsis betulina]|nr:hypothetical protein C8Q72DRAFT_318106 [Fomitopsis betulina]